MSEKRQIVLAWTDDSMEVVRERRTDLGERPDMRPVKVAKTVMWLNEGTPTDVKKAKAHAATADLGDGGPVRVYTYPLSEMDPRSRAAKSVLLGRVRSV